MPGIVLYWSKNCNQSLAIIRFLHEYDQHEIVNSVSIERLHAKRMRIPRFLERVPSAMVTDNRGQKFLIPPEKVLGFLMNVLHVSPAAYDEPQDEYGPTMNRRPRQGEGYHRPAQPIPQQGPPPRRPGNRHPDAQEVHDLLVNQGGGRNRDELGINNYKQACRREKDPYVRGILGTIANQNTLSMKKYVGPRRASKANKPAAASDVKNLINLRPDAEGNMRPVIQSAREGRPK